jgi:predicted enzyme related to lactoylglutathione lyase
MTEKTTYAPGTFCWPELATSAQGAAETFYTTLFGWTTSLTPMGPDSHYTIFLKDGKDVAAGAQMNPDMAKMGVPPYWLSYVSVASVDESAAKATALGAKLVAGPFDVMEHGRMAVFADPTGATFALWQAYGHPGVSLLDAPGALVWTELGTSDLKKSAAFYGALFGWTTDIMKMGDYEYTIWKRGEASAGGMYPITPDMGPVPPHWLPYFGVPDCDEAIAQVKKLGGALVMGPQDIPGTGRIATLKDPQGAHFAILQPA